MLGQSEVVTPKRPGRGLASAAAPAAASNAAGVRPPSLPTETLLPLEDLHETDFEEVCVDIVGKEVCIDIVGEQHEIVAADLKRRKGQGQFGVDAEGFDRRHEPVLVLSAKCYKKISPGQLKKWGDAFLEHLDGHWKDRDVRQFVLAVTVRRNDDGLNKAIKQEAARFAKHGIAYHFWGLKQLTERLRPLPDVIRVRFSAYWVDAICGTTDPVRAGLARPAEGQALQDRTAGGLEAGAARLMGEWLDESERNALVAALEELRQGDGTALRRLVGRLKGDAARWKRLPSALSAQVLRAEAWLALRDGDVALARRRCDEAGMLAAADDRRLDIALTRYESNVTTAIERLGQPGNTADAQLLAGLLIEEGRVGAVEPLLDRWPPDNAALPEDLRLRALARCALRDDRRAIDAAEQAVALQPKRFATRWALAVSRLVAALSPRVRYPLSIEPQPISPRLFRDDADARDNLDRAERLLDELAAATDDPEQAAGVVLWRLAALAGHPARSSEAQALATRLLAEPLPAPGVVAWSLVLGLPVDHDRLIMAYTGLLKSGEGDATHLLAIGWLHRVAGRTRKARKALVELCCQLADARDRRTVEEVLDTTYPEEPSGQKRPAGRRAATTRVCTGVTDPGVAAATTPAPATGASNSDDAPPSVQPASAKAFHAALDALEAGDPAMLIRLLEQEALGPSETFTAFEGLAAHRHWQALDRHREQVLSFAVPRAVELAAKAALESQADGAVSGPEVCIAIIEKARDLYADQTLPYGLALLLADAQQRAGRPDQALRAYERLRPLPDHRAAATRGTIQTLARIGDLAGLQRELADAEARQLLDDRNALILAGLIRAEDPALARLLVGGVDPRQLPDELVPAALDTALAMNLGHWLEALLPGLMDPLAARKAGVRLIDSVDDALRLVDERAAQDQRAQTAWLDSAAPLHATLDRWPALLGRLFHEPFTATPTSPGDRMPLLLRAESPARAVEPADRPGIDKLQLDITALLLGHELDLLGHLETIAGTIAIAPEAPAALHEITEAIAGLSPVPAPSPSLRADLEAIDTGTIDVRLANEAEKTTLPLRVALRPAADPATGAPPASERASSPIVLADLARFLVTHDGLDPACLRDIEAWVDPGEELPSLPANRHLLLDGPSLHLLSATGSLRPISRLVMLHVTAATLDSGRQAVQDQQRRDDHVRSLKALRLFVTEQLRSGAWRILPHRQRDLSHPALAAAGNVLRGLASLEHAGSRATTATWIEDRFASTIGRIDNGRIIDVVELLDRLRAAGTIDQSAFTIARDRLRAAGYGFWLPEADEVVDELLKAPLRGRALIETERLTRLRIGLSLQADHLHHIRVRQDASTARPFRRLIQMPAAILVALWSTADAAAEVGEADGAAEHKRRAAADWVWQNLRLAIHPALAKEATSLDNRQRIVRPGLEALVSTALTFQEATFSVLRDNRRRYLDWVFGRVIEPFARVEPGGAEAVVEELAQSIAKLLDMPSELPAEKPELHTLYLKAFLEDLPESWGSRLLRHEILHDRLDTKTVSVVTIANNLQFESTTFYAALAEMLVTGRGETSDIATSTTATLTPSAAGSEQDFVLAWGDRRYHVIEEALLLAHADPAVRRSVITEHPEWLDLPTDTLARKASDIAHAASVGERFQLLYEARSQCLSWRLAAVRRQLRDSPKLDAAYLLPPSPALVRHYLRLPDLAADLAGDQPNVLAAALERAASTLMSSFGAREAARRLAGIPVTLPATLLGRLAEAVAEQEDRVQALLNEIGHSAMVATALAHAGLQHAKGQPDQLLQLLVETLSASSRTFLAVLEWVYRRATRDPEWQALPALERSMLAWGYAHALALAFQEGNAQPEVIDWLEGADPLTEIEAALERQAGPPAWFGAIGLLGKPTLDGLAGKCLGHVLGAWPASGPALPPALAARLRPLVTKGDAGRLAPALELLLPPGAGATARAAACSWVMADASAVLQRHGVIAIPETYRQPAPMIAKSILDELATYASDGDAHRDTMRWLLLLDPALLDQEARQRLLALPPLGNATSLAGSADAERRFFLQHRAKLFAAEDDEAGFIAMLEAEIDKVTSRLGRHARVGHDLDHDDLATTSFRVITSVSLAFAAAAPSRQAMMTRLAETTERLVDSWPGALHGALALLDHSVRRVSIADGETVWPIIHRLRRR